MELKRQWCDNKACPDFGKIDAGHIEVFSYVGKRYYCMRCRHTFSADKGTVFETIRKPHLSVTDALALLNERNSLRAVERLKHLSTNRLLYWLDLAGGPAASVSATLIRYLHLSPVQIDELWTFVKKKQEHRRPDDPADVGDMWVWRALALPSRLRVVNHLSPARTEREATAFLAQFKAKTDGCAPLFTSDQLPA